MRKKKNLVRLSAMMLICPAITLNSYAKGGIDTEYADVHITGGAAAGYYAAARGVTSRSDQNRLSDFLLGIYTSSKDEMVEMNAGIGILPSYTLLDNDIDGSTNTTEVQYAALSMRLTEGLMLEMGRISSNIGYENTPSYLNAHSIGSIQATTQPGYFPGTRLTCGNEETPCLLKYSKYCSRSRR